MAVPASAIARPALPEALVQGGRVEHSAAHWVGARFGGGIFGRTIPRDVR